MRNYKCASCGKTFDPEKNDICPACGAAVAPSVMTRIERKRTAQRMRAEGKFNYDEHCHEDETWKGSSAAQNHRAAVQAHEANLRAGYAAHRAADHPTRQAGTSAASAARSTKKKKTLGDRIQQNPFLILLVFLIPFALFFVMSFLRTLIEWLSDLGGLGFNFP